MNLVCPDCKLSMVITKNELISRVVQETATHEWYEMRDYLYVVQDCTGCGLRLTLTLPVEVTRP